MDNTGVHNSNFTNNITPNNYKTSNFLTVYDFSPDLSNGFRLRPPQIGTLDLDIGFNKALKESIYMIMYTASPAMVTINESRNVVLID